MKLIKTILIALTLAAGGCSVMEMKPLGKEMLKNSKGHVIGYREVVCDCGRGEEFDRVILFTPRLSEGGTVVAYEERTKGGAVLRDLSGKRIGTRYVDLRSRGTNAHNRGLTIVFRPATDTERLAVVAQVSIDDIKQYLQQN